MASLYKFKFYQSWQRGGGAVRELSITSLFHTTNTEHSTWLCLLISNVKLNSYICNFIITKFPSNKISLKNCRTINYIMQFEKHNRTEHLSTQNISLSMSLWWSSNVAIPNFPPQNFPTFASISKANQLACQNLIRNILCPISVLVDLIVATHSLVTSYLNYCDVLFMTLTEQWKFYCFRILQPGYWTRQAVGGMQLPYYKSFIWYQSAPRENLKVLAVKWLQARELLGLKLCRLLQIITNIIIILLFL